MLSCLHGKASPTSQLVELASSCKQGLTVSVITEKVVVVMCVYVTSLVKELVCSLVTGLLAMPLGVLQFIPVYHSLHDGFQIHSEICVLLFLTLLFLIAWTGDRRPSAEARTATLSGM